MQAVATYPGSLYLLVLSDGVLRVASPGAEGHWGPWMKIEPWVLPPTIFGLPGAAPLARAVYARARGNLVATLSSASQDGLEI